jgi:hypothetical protein
LDQCDLLDNLRVCSTGFDDLFLFPAPHSLMCEPTRYHVIFLVGSSKDWAPFLYRRERFIIPRRAPPVTRLLTITVLRGQTVRLCSSPTTREADRPASPVAETPKSALVAKPPGFPARWSSPVFVSPPIIYFHDEFSEFSSSHGSLCCWRSWPRSR